MLLQFTVENFRSIKNKAFLSLIPSSTKEHENNIAVNGNLSALKTIAMYGANASGKSNVFKAIIAALITIRTSNSRSATDQMDLMVPFSFDEKTASSPCEFEFTFIAQDNQKYVYGFSADKQKVYSQYLCVYHTSNPSRIFERTESEYHYNKTENEALKPLEPRNISNKLFIATASSWGYKPADAPYKWLAEEIQAFTDFSAISGISVGKYADDDAENLKPFTKNLLRQADINIDGYELSSQSIQIEPDTPLSAPFLRNSFVTVNGNSLRANRIYTYHTVYNDNSTEQQYKLNLYEESQGTKNVFMLSPILKETFENGKTLLIDELDRSLHPLLAQYFVDLFQDPEVNSTNAQLVFSVHNTKLLSLNTLRRDQIYFVEKNAKTAVTDLYSLDEFSVRKSENVERGYLLGRYGAVPNINPGVDW